MRHIGTGTGFEAASDLRAAWQDRMRFLRPTNDDPRRSAFVTLAFAGSASRVTVGRLAARLGISGRHLSRLTLEWFGHSPGAVLRVARLARVARDLLDTTESLRTIARRNGFSSRQALNREFRACFGMAPRDLRPEPMGSGRAGLAAVPRPGEADPASRAARLS